LVARSLVPLTSVLLSPTHLLHVAHAYHSLLCFFLVLPRPPISTLFPYTTLFRSNGCCSKLVKYRGNTIYFHINDRQFHQFRSTRSEEHTSELQSRFDLVCRLLLEKKKRRRIPRERGVADDTGRRGDHGERRSSGV